MSRSSEYVERLVAEGYRRELDQDENVVRSLPFFATSLGVLATAIGLARPAIGPFEWSAMSVAIHAALVATALAILLVLLFLVAATRPRRFETIMEEGALIEFRASLEEYYMASGAGAATLEEAVTADLREEVTQQLARAAAVTRRNNLARLKARGRAVLALLVAIFLAFVILGLILVRDAVSSGAGHVGDGAGSAAPAGVEEHPRPADGARDPEARAPADADGHPGRLDLPRGRPAAPDPR